MRRCRQPVGIRLGANMETTGVQRTKTKPENAPLTAPERSASAGVSALRAPKPAGYGLPCSKCRMYYPSDMDCCPVCNSPERVSPTAEGTAKVQLAPATPPNPSAPPVDDRDRLLKELRSQILQAHTQINAAATFRCSLDQNHDGDSEPAAVCHNCYGELRQQADRMEAALHIDLKEAAQIVYQAVWTDSSDPSKTYENAATALLSEIRKRAGIGLLLGSNRPLSH
jgi:hypothetical protein